MKQQSSKITFSVNEVEEEVEELRLLVNVMLPSYNNKTEAITAVGMEGAENS